MIDTRKSEDGLICTRCGTLMDKHQMYECCSFRICGPHRTKESGGVPCPGPVVNVAPGISLQKIEKPKESDDDCPFCAT